MKLFLTSLLIFLTSALSYAEFSNQSNERECVNFSGIYLSDDPGTFESCIEIRQNDCREYSYIWHLDDKSSIAQINKTDSQYRSYPSEPDVLKSFTHDSDGSHSFKFYEKGRPETVREAIHTKLKNGNIHSRFYPDRSNSGYVIESTYHLLNSVQACFK